ncbi:MAG: CDP-diacylglycerol--glycerol-3-phosphate 3-phosphatidyltransferase [Rhodospirillales bacterium]
MMTSIPNLLTLSRIAAVPVMIAVMLFLEGSAASWTAFWIYTYACVTDFFDGYVARIMNEQSPLGRFLDPIADKLLVAAVLMLLAGYDKIGGWTLLPALIILMREILVSGLREFLAELHISVPVSNLAKWKTTIQMLALGFLIVGEHSPEAVPSVTIGTYGIWAAALLTLVTGYDYLRAGLRHIAAPGKA